MLTLNPCTPLNPGAPNGLQVKKMVLVVETGSDDRNLLAGFKSQQAELTKLAAEARDNVKFLTTLVGSPGGALRGGAGNGRERLHALCVCMCVLRVRACLCMFCEQPCM
jgi:hypothetical protein